MHKTDHMNMIKPRYGIRPISCLLWSLYVFYISSSKLLCVELPIIMENDNKTKPGQKDTNSSYSAKETGANTFVVFLSLSSGMTAETWSASITSKDGHMTSTRTATKRHLRYAHKDDDRIYCWKIGSHKDASFGGSDRSPSRCTGRFEAEKKTRKIAFWRLVSGNLRPISLKPRARLFFFFASSYLSPASDRLKLPGDR